MRLVGEAGKVKELSFAEEEVRVDRNYLSDVAGCRTHMKPSRTIASRIRVSESSNSGRSGAKNEKEERQVYLWKGSRASERSGTHLSQPL